MYFGYSKSVFLIILFIFLLMSCKNTSNVVKVIDVIDGDTIVIEGGYHVRYIGIDAPEKDAPFYQDAKKINEDLVLERKVVLEKDVSDTDKYGRLLRYVFIDDMFINAEITQKGLALAEAYPPDIKYQVYLEALENEARQKRDGIWNSEK